MPSSCRSSPDLIRRCRPWLGTFVEVTGESEATVEAAYQAIARAHRLMSFQDPASELARLNRAPVGQPFRCDPWTAEVLRRALFWWRGSDGAFNPARAAGSPGFAVEGNLARRTMDVQIDLSGIAKGFAVDRAVDAMGSAGGEAGLVNAGGDLRCFGPRTWEIAVVDPDSRAPAVAIELRDGALATSAPQPAQAGETSLWGRAPHLRSASVQCALALDADALTKIVLADAPRADHCLAVAGAEALVLTPEGWMHRGAPGKAA